MTEFMQYIDMDLFREQMAFAMAVGLSLIIIYYLFVFIISWRDYKEEENTIKNKKSYKIEYDLKDYICKFENLNIKDTQISNKLKILIKNLYRLQEVNNKLLSDKGEKFADKYLPTLLDMLKLSSGLDIPIETKETIIKTITLFDIAINETVKQVQEPVFADIHATSTSLSAMLELNYKESDFKLNGK